MNYVFRCFVEKKPGFDVEARQLLQELREQLGITSLSSLRLFNRYDVDHIDYPVYLAAKPVVFSEPQCDTLYDENLPPLPANTKLLAIESLPGQYDQRADSCAQCIQLLSSGERPMVAVAQVYALTGELTQNDLEKIKAYLINPVERRQASMEKPSTLSQNYPAPPPVPVLEHFIQKNDAQLQEVLEHYGLAMDLTDLQFLQAYFRDEEKRDPTLTELRVVDTYWSDHCRHTTFGTHLDQITIHDPEVQKAYDQYLALREEVYGKSKAAKRPQTLMDLATIGSKVLKKQGLLQNLDESEEINACSIHVTATVNGKKEDWLLMFKNETHNHPTEIEPFGGAATCIGGAIRDPLSGRSYVYQAMRVTGCADPRTPLEKTLPGKLPQRKIAVTAAAGYSSYGNQIGLATGLVNEIYHPGYVAKHLEVGAVVGAAPASRVVRERPVPGDVVVLLGGRTGRDGIGGATGSSKTHNAQSLNTMASEVQKGNAPEERKLQRLFRNPEVTRLIKRCNDFGAGGVSVAIGELADGLNINLDAVRKKYDGLDGTELAISESQERMAVVVAPENLDAFLAAAQAENLEAYQVASVTEEPRMVMTWNGEVIANLSRAFLSSNGADKHTSVEVPVQGKAYTAVSGASLIDKVESILHNPNFASQRGLMERFDATIGAGSVLFPFGGKNQQTPTQSMAALLPVDPGQETEDCSVMAYGFDPFLSEQSPFWGASCAVVDSMAKLVASGCDPDQIYLTFQEYFERLRDEPQRWGKPFAALLGALNAQIGLGAAAIGGKDSMSGTFLDLDVPPTLISFAIAPAKAPQVLSPEFKAINHQVYLFSAPAGDYQGTKTMWKDLHGLMQKGKILSGWAVGSGGIMEGIMKMSFGNDIGFVIDPAAGQSDLFAPAYGSILVESEEAIEHPNARLLGTTAYTPMLELPDCFLPINELRGIWEGTLEDVYPTQADPGVKDSDMIDIFCKNRSPLVASEKFARPRAVIPVFPGTNCEDDTASACLKAGIEPEILVVRNLEPAQLADSASQLAEAIGRSQMLILPGGFSGGDEPDGSAKFIVSFFHNPVLTDAVHELLKHRDGLALGICNGFQALLKLGLLVHGEIRPADETFPTLTFNLIGRHQSRYVTTRVASVASPWMIKSELDDIYTIPVSHGEGRFVAPPAVLASLIANGQVATQYVDTAGIPSMDISVNPNGSMESIEGLFSPDGRVFGKMGHSERKGPFIAKNIPGCKHQPIFESGAAYFK